MRVWKETQSQVVVPASFGKIRVWAGKNPCQVYFDNDVFDPPGRLILEDLHWDTNIILGEIFNPEYDSVIATSRCREPGFQPGERRHDSQKGVVALFEYFNAMLHAYRLGFDLDSFAFTEALNVKGGRCYDPDLPLPTTSISSNKSWRLLVAMEKVA